MVRARGNHVGPDSNLFFFFRFFFLQLEIQFSSGPPVVPHNDPRVALAKLEIPLLTYLTTPLVLCSENAALALWSHYKNAFGERTPRLSPDSNDVVSPVRGGYNPHCYRTAG